MPGYTNLKLAFRDCAFVATTRLSAGLACSQRRHLPLIGSSFSRFGRRQVSLFTNTSCIYYRCVYQYSRTAIPYAPFVILRSGSLFSKHASELYESGFLYGETDIHTLPSAAIISVSPFSSHRIKDALTTGYSLGRLVWPHLSFQVYLVL